jgi:hypothetical protein
MRTSSVVLLLLAACTAACSATAEPQEDASADAIRKLGTTSPPWLYEGPMPALESPSIVVSITGHTARITGLLPADYDVAKLPYYVEKESDGDRVRVHVVYPVATGRKVNGKWNNVPGTYDHLNVRPYRPNDTSKEHWGGFPFLNYHDDRRFAFHGPIDFVDDPAPGGAPSQQDWRLVRGRTSAGCQRMQGEHDLELTHMLGFDMHKPWTTKTNRADPKNGVEGQYIAADLKVLAEPLYDRIDGAIVDVDYAKDATVAPLPDGEPVRTFRTWDANDMLAWACPVKPADDPNRTRVTRDDPRFDGGYCARTNGSNRLDPSTGAEP